ncbi:TraR/DksA C4-type zinc finger protein [Microbacterium sp. LRZ72]|uniref:TraR/DksA family transcriptional regulator n=1 Tax=Microbacterium sp. LRZ72 TaxID=2942481 RepID=UPI0029BBB726|nr:TraR/DksA C4-type zinc finger protein [Microbacterium sp. LRZ72]MDX2375235.1 TraR/DksA C4-type zinc finger protein [Microbacterium sp. LRZ72]
MAESSAGATAARHARFIDDRRRAVRERLALLEEQLTGIRHAREEWTDDEHDPEGSTLVTEWSRAEGLRGEHLAELAELDRAEERLRTDRYGVCEGCGEPLSEGRLRARPAAVRCVPCVEAARRR